MVASMYFSTVLRKYIHCDFVISHEHTEDVTTDTNITINAVCIPPKFIIIISLLTLYIFPRKRFPLACFFWRPLSPPLSVVFFKSTTYGCLMILLYHNFWTLSRPFSKKVLTNYNSSWYDIDTTWSEDDKNVWRTT